MAASRQDSHLLFWPSLAEACVWLSKDPVWSRSSLGRYCLCAEPVSSKVSGSSLLMAPGEIFACSSLIILLEFSFPFLPKRERESRVLVCFCTGNRLCSSSGILMSCSDTGACLRLTIGEIILSPADLPLGPVSCPILSSLGAVFPKCWLQ